MTQAPGTQPSGTPTSAMPAPAWRKALFLALAAAVLWPWEYAAQAALAMGMVLAVSGFTAFEAQSKKTSRYLIQVCVVLLGLRVDLASLLGELRHGGVLAVATVFGTLAAGLALGKLLKTQRDVSLLVSSGTAICGGSAIAAVGASIGAESSAIAVATGAIFVLNAIGLFTLPAIGQALQLTPDQFGVWAGTALHDIASVAGAGKAYGTGEAAGIAGGAAAVAMIVKLTRVVWITPIALAARRWWVRDGGEKKGSSPFPWFILAFFAASGLRTMLPGLKEYETPIKTVAGCGFQLALFLIGCGLSKKALASVGWRALVQAVVLWVLIAGASLVAVREFL